MAGDKGYDTRGFVAEVRPRLHSARRPVQQSAALRHRLTHHRRDGHAVSMRIRKRIEEPSGSIKTIGDGRELRSRGRRRHRAWFRITTAVYNLIRMTALDAQHT